MINNQPGEQPLKRVAARKAQESTLDPDDMDAEDDDNLGTALYAPYQTTLYAAPSVMNSRIPRNVYGNIDVYVPSMIPRGGAHILHPETARAARIIGIDYADAVTGFSFRGRHGSAITNGAVVAAEYREAVEEVIKAFEDERAQAEEERRTLAALKTWKRFLVGLRIRERIEGYDIEGERDTAMRYAMEKATDQDGDEDEDEGGGFLPDRDADEIARPTATTVSTRNISDWGNDDESREPCMSEEEQEDSDHVINSAHDDDNHDDDNHDDDDDDDDDNYSNDDDDYDDDTGGGFGLDADQQIATRKNSEEDYRETSHGYRKSAVHMSAENDAQGVFNQGSGFLPHDNGITEDATADDSRDPSNSVGSMLKEYGSINSYGPPENEKQFEKAFPDLSAGELEEARSLQQLYESQSTGHLPVYKEDNTVPVPSRTPDLPSIPESIVRSEPKTLNNPSGTYASNEHIREQDIASESSEEDKGSLLSHDPDDEDADPEWLA